MQQKQHADADGNNKQHEHQEDGIKPPSITAICIWAFVAFSFLIWPFLRDHIPDESEYVKVGVESMFSLALVILVAVQTALYLRQAKALDAQLEETRKMVRYGNAAYVA